MQGTGARFWQSGYCCDILHYDSTVAATARSIAKGPREARTHQGVSLTQHASTSRVS
jgi:hypothetical protein